jgi:hypothetical protein
MHLVEIKQTKDERASQIPLATPAYEPKANGLSNAAPTRIRKRQHLDVDGILARSLPNLWAFSVAGVK